MKTKISLNFYLVFLSLILSWFAWLCYMIPLPGGIKADDVTNVLTIIFFLIVLLGENMIRNIPLNKQFVYFCAIVVTSSIAAKVMFDQPVIKGILVLRNSYIQYSIAIPLFYLIKSGRMKREQLYDTLVMMARVAATIYVLFYLLHTYVGINILKIESTSYQRYGSDRFMFNVEMQFFLLGNAFSNLYAERMKLINYYDIILVLYLILYVTKMRYAALCCAIAIIIGLMVAKKFNLKKILLYIGACCAGAVLLIFTDMGQEFLNMILGGDFFSSNTETIREIGRVKHLLSFLKSPVFGLGHPHEDCYAAAYEFGALNSYYLNGFTGEKIYISDNGIFDLLYIFGLSGIVWVFSFFGVWLKKSIRLIRNRNTSSFFLFLMIQILGMYTGCTWLFFGMVTIGVFDALIRSEPEKLEEADI